MGLFSALCQGCYNPILPTFNTEPLNSWMADCVAIHRSGVIVRGFYDGYGRLTNAGGEVVAGDYESDDPVIGEPVCSWTENNDGPTVWHASPPEYRGQSENAPDQGHFFEAGTYDIPDPDLEMLK